MSKVEVVQGRKSTRRTVAARRSHASEPGKIGEFEKTCHFWASRSEKLDPARPGGILVPVFIAAIGPSAPCRGQPLDMASGRLKV